jgi:hypothetical protein
MYIPFISSRLSKRRGHGDGGGGGDGHSSGSHDSGSSSSTSSSHSSGADSETAHSSVSGTVGGSAGKHTASTGFGGGKAITIPAGQPFAGRAAGGGDRDEIFGTRLDFRIIARDIFVQFAFRIYGSGYGVGYTGRGVFGRGFPFFYWPMIWGPGIGAGAAYLHDSEVRPISHTIPYIF